MTTWAQRVGHDLRNISRDPMLVIALGVPIMFGLLVRAALPWVTREVGVEVIPHYYGLFAAALILMPPLVLGWIVGFMLLEERDENILAAISVTPMSKSRFLLYRLSLPVPLSAVASLLVVPIAGIPLDVGFGPLLVASLVAAVGAPNLAAFLAAFAPSKVEGLALVKVYNMTILAPALPFFVDSNWRFLGGVVPTYWVGELLVPGTSAGQIALYAVAGIAAQLLVLSLFLRRFERRRD